MAEPLKNIYSEAFLDEFAGQLKQFHSPLNSDLFLQEVFADSWEKLELKERMRRIAEVLRTHLPDDLSQALDILCKLSDFLRGDTEESMSFPHMFIPEFIQQYGLAHYELSVQAMERITQFSSCEFAIRPFLCEYPERSMQQMQKWAHHPQAMVRRLASEGSRPRLPWGLGVPYLKVDPRPTLPILEALKDDTSETVRRSVANHLNDIAKDHPELVLGLVEDWSGRSRNTDRLIRHACRGLLKQSHPRALALFGLGQADKIEVSHLQLESDEIKVGDYLHFSFKLEHAHDSALTIRLEYAIYFLKANGSWGKKVFKISEKEHPQGEAIAIQRKQSFRPITTRTYYPGTHRISIIANGREFEPATFQLKID